MSEKSDKKHNNILGEKSLFLFFPASDQLGSVFKTYKVLNKLVIIGQNIESLEGIEDIRNLEELWVVECNLQQENVEPVSKCWGLKNLYLYDNELTAIPNLEPLTKLSHLWLSDNRLESLQGINGLSNVRELYLSNNNIAAVDTKLQSTLKIVFLNLAGNPIKSMKEVQKLQSLRTLRWLVLSDPLFRTSPVSLLANLRPMVVHILPGLEKLDMLDITQAERAQTVKFFDAQLEYYRMYLHSSVAKLYDSHKKSIELEMKQLEIIWNALKRHFPSNKKDESFKSSDLRFWENECHRWKERLKLTQTKFAKLTQVITEAFNLEVENCGNIQFLEFNLADSEAYEKLKNKIHPLVCSYLKRHVLDIDLLNVWCIKGHYQTTVLQSKFQNDVDHVYIVTPVADLGIQALKVMADILFGNKLDQELLLTKCLAQADPMVCDDVCLHRQLLLRSQTLLNSRLMVVCGVDDPSQITVQMGSSHGCSKWSVGNPSVLVPLYMLHYQYVFKDYFNLLKMLPDEVELVSNQTPLPTSIDEISASQHVTVLELISANLKKLDFPVMEHLTTLDLSYNQLEDISSMGSLFPKLTILNLAHNRIHTLPKFQGLQNVSQLTLSWNFLSDFLSALKSLKGLRSLKHVDLSYNPFRDVICDLHQQFFVCKHLKSLMTFNDCPLSRSLLRGEVTLQGQEEFPLVPAWRRSRSPISLRWKSELSETGSENHLGVINNQVISITLKGLKLSQFRSVLSLRQLKWLDLSDNLLYRLSTLKGMSALEEVNLSHNVIEIFTCASDGFKHLSKLDLSHNYISCLDGFTRQTFPHLKYLDLSNNKLQSLVGLSSLKTLIELYLSNNLLQEMNTVSSCRDMKELRVLDVSYNPLTQNESFRGVCLYHINSLKYINGSKVRPCETKNAVSLYEGVLDQDYIIRANKSATIDNLTQLSLSRCNIKKLDPSLILPNLSSLILDHNKISSLSWVRSFPNLARLCLSHNRVSSFGGDCSPLSATPDFPSLKTLILDNNHIKDLPSLKLHLFPNLKMLVLLNNEIASLSGLKKNCRLEHLVLDKNKLSSISCDQTAQLVNLLELYLERNSLTKLGFVRPLTKLQKLFIGHNKLVDRTSLDPLTNLPNLVELTIHGNPVFRSHKSYRDCLPPLPSLKMLEGQPVNESSLI